jgi:hypothetical protein
MSEIRKPCPRSYVTAGLKGRDVEMFEEVMAAKGMTMAQALRASIALMHAKVVAEREGRAV